MRMDLAGMSPSAASLIEWSCFALAGGLAMLLVAKTHLPRSLRVLFSSLLLLSVLSAVIWQRGLNRQVRARERWAEKLPRANRPDGYVSSDKCQACHPSQYASWHATFHRTMTQVAAPENVIGPI